MPHTHLPRSIIILLVILVAVSFFIGTLRAFTPARAVAIASATPTSTLVLTKPSSTAAEPENESLGSTPSVANTTQAASSENITPIPSPTPEPEYIADMTGIIALGILMVFVILVGMIWGEFSLRKKKEPK